MGDKPSAIFDDDAVSHSLCEPCLHSFMAQLGMPLDEYIEGIPDPVVTVTQEGVVGSANKAARAIIGNNVNDQHRLPGDILECENARTPEGCGRTVHCSGCVIRSAIEDTLKTGESHEHVPATLQKASDDASETVDILISTEQKGGVVFLKIDQVQPVEA
ncbi:hypothetical protein BVX94_00170 [bacterium B17]|nr:hypothetical protein BVX94_00170 [bacterium B17]